MTAYGPATAGPGIVTTGQKLAPGELVEMFIIDLSPLRVNQQFAFTTKAFKNRGAIVFRGVTFTPVDVQAQGFEFNGRGAFPQPIIRVGNATRIMSSAALLYQDLIGARLIRWRTFAQFLDNGETPSPDDMYAPDIYNFEQKTSHNKRQIEWKLASAMDQEGRKLPGRVILRDLCLFRYRRWDKDLNAFDMSHVACPYAGSAYFDKDGNPVASAAEDRPSRKLSTCCKPRFGAGPYPFGGFPGVNRIKV